MNLENEDYVNDPKFISLIDGLDKKREYETVINERRMQLQELQKKYDEQKRQLETLSKAKDENQDVSRDIVEDEEPSTITEEDLQNL